MSHQTRKIRLVLAAGWLLISSAASAETTTIYWARSGSPNAIQSSDITGVTVTTLLTDATQDLREVAIDQSGEKIYFVSALVPGADNKIKRADLDGSNQEDLILLGSGVPNFLELDVANGKMYWTQLDAIHRANLDGSGEEVVLTLATNANGLAIDTAAGKMYWIVSDGPDTKIRRADLNGTNVTDLLTIPGESAFAGLGIGLGKLYWGNFSNEIRKVNLNGTGLGTVVTLSDFAFRVHVDEQDAKLYWILLDTPFKIQRANLNGTGVEDYHVVATGEFILDVQVTNAQPIPTVSTWGLVVMVLLVLSAGTVIHARQRGCGQS